jgi:hypothetical protein
MYILTHYPKNSSAMKRGFRCIDNAPSPPNNPKRGFMTIKSKVKVACNKFGFPDMSHKITPSIVLFNPAVPAVRLGVVRRAMSKEQIPSFNDAASVYVSKGKSKIGTMTSPFNVHINGSINTGTTTGDTTGVDLPRGVPLEQYWQAAKVSDMELDASKQPDAAYYTRRAKIYGKGVVKRRYIGKGLGIAGAVFNNDHELIPYVQSRIYYCRAYEDAVENMPAFKLLSELVNVLGVPLLLLGPDAYPFAIGETWQHAYNDTSKPFGHERVLAAMLSMPTADRPWNCKFHKDK